MTEEQHVQVAEMIKEKLNHLLWYVDSPETKNWNLIAECLSVLTEISRKMSSHEFVFEEGMCETYCMQVEEIPSSATIQLRSGYAAGSMKVYTVNAINETKEEIKLFYIKDGLIFLPDSLVGEKILLTYRRMVKGAMMKTTTE